MIMTTFSKRLTLILVAAMGFALVLSTDAIADPPVGDCGNGLELVYNPAIEAFIATATQGNVNFDGWVCVNTKALENGGRNFIVITDNNRQGPPQ